MVHTQNKPLTLDDFFALPEGDIIYEFVEGRAVPKFSSADEEVDMSREWLKDEACPVCPELAIEIISIDQTFGEMMEKATSYLTAGISCVWVIDPKAKSITVFEPNTLPKTYRGSQPLTSSALTGLQITPQEIFQQAGLS
ncbi:MAG: Uma2 family endonuclease [Cyanobacteria bacterium P01_F01_bin.150]